MHQWIPLGLVRSKENFDTDSAARYLARARQGFERSLLPRKPNQLHISFIAR